MTVNCQAILFDLDGTLIDSGARIQRLWLTWSNRHGIPLEAILRVMHGRRAAETIQTVAPHLSVAAEVIALETDEIADMDGVTAYPGAMDLLNKLAPGQWAVVTSGSQEVAAARLRYVQLPIPPVFITGDDVRQGKPDPEGYALAARRLNVPPDACVVLEDAPAGVRAAKAAGMQVVAILSTHSPEALTEADLLAPRLSALQVRVDGSIIRVNLES